MIAPEDVVGRWRRAWIDAGGQRDSQTRVIWWQAAGGYCDIRLPADPPDTAGADALADLDAGTLSQLLRAEGFAGTISVADTLCTWTRAINFHGTPETADIGRLSWDADGALIEDGGQAPYRERWTRDAAGQPNRAVWHAGSWQLHLVWDATAFLLGTGCSTAPPLRALSAALAHGARPEAPLRAAFDAGYVFGRWDGDTGIATHAINPFHVGRPVLDRKALTHGRAELALPCFNGRIETRCWTALSAA